MDINMVDLQSQYLKIKDEIDNAINKVISEGAFIKGPYVKNFEESLAKYLKVKHVIGCANGTDAIQVSLMSLGLNKGDEIIVPSFTFIGTAEPIALLGLTPVFVDVDPYSFNLDMHKIEAKITPRTKAIMPFHLFGQSAEMEPIISLAKKK